MTKPIILNPKNMEKWIKEFSEYLEDIKFEKEYVGHWLDGKWKSKDKICLIRAQKELAENILEKWLGITIYQHECDG